ncbi:hypothetical protein FRB94_002478 [Tulasnella sp. JGI-2019a]|nr:hypothetical protein FRB93_003985 [Tulasnella sp. JGI-2019a]KAG9004258.1 hypothetical protein FRB94_002478 [Tulasnella sp. JGI-2019a]
MTGLVTPFFYFSAFILLLLVTLSTPVNKTTWLFDVVVGANVGAGIRQTVRFGVLGWCSSSVAFKLGTVAVNDPAACSAAHLGFAVSPGLWEVLKLTRQTSLVDALRGPVSVILILHIVVASSSSRSCYQSSAASNVVV